MSLCSLCQHCVGASGAGGPATGGGGVGGGPVGECRETLHPARVHRLPRDHSLLGIQHKAKGRTPHVCRVTCAPGVSGSTCVTVTSRVMSINLFPPEMFTYVCTTPVFAKSIVPGHSSQLSNMIIQHLQVIYK